MPIATGATPTELDKRIALQNLTFHKQSVLTGLSVLYQRQSGAHLLQMPVVTVYECRTVMPAKPVIQFTLGALYTFKGSESQKMGLSHIGYKSKIGLAYLHQFLNVSRMAGTHLNYGILMLRSQSKHSKRHTY